MRESERDRVREREREREREGERARERDLDANHTLHGTIPVSTRLGMPTIAAPLLGNVSIAVYYSPVAAKKLFAMHDGTPFAIITAADVHG